MPEYVERKLSSEENREFNYCAKKGYEILGISIEEGITDSIVEKVDKYVDNWQKRQRNIFHRIFWKKPDVIDTSLALGIIWGNQIVKQFNWQWTCVIQGKNEYYGVVSLDRSMVIYPTYFIKACLDNARMDCTAMLSYNMLKANKIPKFRENEYRNVIEGIHRIVPKA